MLSWLMDYPIVELLSLLNQHDMCSFLLLSWISISYSVEFISLSLCFHHLKSFCDCDDNNDDNNDDDDDDDDDDKLTYYCY